MSKQPRHVRDALERLKANGLVTPNQRDPRQCWLLVCLHPKDNNKGEFFVTHAMNYDKFAKQKDKFEVIGHGYDKVAIAAAARKLTLRLGEAYQPKFSAFREGPADLGSSAEQEDEAPDSSSDFQVKSSPSDFIE